LFAIGKQVRNNLDAGIALIGKGESQPACSSFAQFGAQADRNASQMAGAFDSGDLPIPNFNHLSSVTGCRH
jgi:hypothetical protein